MFLYSDVAWGPMDIEQRIYFLRCASSKSFFNIYYMVYYFYALCIEKYNNAEQVGK